MKRKLSFRAVRRILICVAIFALCMPLHSADAQIWIGGFSDQWFHAANWSDGTVPLEPDDDVVIGAPSPTILQQTANLNSLVVGADGILDIGVGNFTRRVEFGGAAQTTLENAGTINVMPRSRLEFENIVINSGDINVTSNGAVTLLQIDDSGAVVSGGGTITLAGDSWISNVSSSSVNPMLTIEDQTIQGSGRVGNSLIGILNSAGGLIEANVSGETLRVGSREVHGGLVNQGVMRASGGGQLEIQQRVFDNNLIEALDGSNVFLSNASITGGTLRSFGSGNFSATGSNRLEDLTFDSSMQIPNAPFVEIAGDINNMGLIEVNSPGGGIFSQLGVDGSTTLTGGGTIRLNGENAAVISQPSSPGLLTLENQTIEGQGEIGRGHLDLFIGPNGRINANVPGETLTIDTADDEFVNLGTLQSSNGGILVILDEVVGSGGTLQVGAGSVFETDTLEVEANERLAGAGTFIANGPIDNTFSAIAGIIAPGDADSPGALRLAYQNRGAVMSPTASLEIDIANDLNFDSLEVSDGGAGFEFEDVKIDGTLSVNLLDGFFPAERDRFVIVSAQLVPECPQGTGDFTCEPIPQFSNVDLITTVGGEGTFEIEYDPFGVTLGNFIPAQASNRFTNGRLQVVGSTEVDDIRVTSTGAGGEVLVSLNGIVENFSGVTDVRVNGYSDDDVINVTLGGNSFVSATINGGSGDDIITLNGRVRGVIHGDEGNDVIFGGSGPDEIFGGDGIDELFGRGGADFIDAGFEFLQNPGVHVLEGGNGADVIIGSAGDDEILGNNGADTIEGLGGDDVIDGGLGNDSINGGPGMDEIHGGFANDEINGGPGDDLITGGPGLDTLIGSLGDDEIFGGAGADQLFGGQGNDLILAGPEADFAAGGIGDDTIVGGEGPDLLLGQGGNDSVSGSGGNDSLSGGPGIDALNGGAGNDTALDTGETETGIEN